MPWKQKMNVALFAGVMMIFYVLAFADAVSPATQPRDIAAQNWDAVNALVKTITECVDNFVKQLDRWVNEDLHEYVRTFGNAIIITIVFFIIGVIFLCILAPGVYVGTTCTEVCCTSRKEIREMKTNEKFKNFYDRLAALEKVAGIKTEIEIMDVPTNKPVEDKKAGEKKSGKSVDKKGSKKDDKKDSKGKVDKKKEESIGITCE